MKYIKKFDSHTDYNTYITNTKNLPNVSLCRNDNEEHVHFNPKDYSKEYLTTVARENGTISFNIWQSMGTDMITSISYSTDNGETWTTTANQDNKSENLVIDVDVNTGDKVLWKGIANQLGNYIEDEYGSELVGSFFSSDCGFDAKGNVMSLLYGDNFKGQTTIEEDYAFCNLFYDYYEKKACNIVNAKDLSLPATTLANWCYNSMFYGCSLLITAPELPATTLTERCYYMMFDGCTSLTTAPELPATTLASNCYDTMFGGCTSLTTAPELPATTLASNCYVGMFAYCISLVTAPALPATTLANYCYQYMFADCSALTTAPELPVTTLAEGCYNGMFQGCTSLTTAPELPATTLANECYSYMFYGCTSLVTAPELSATTLTTRCYNFMFYGCTSLNYIKAMFTTTPSITYTQNWVYNVSSTGTFVKNSEAQWNVTGNNGIPSGWTVQTASE